MSEEAAAAAAKGFLAKSAVARRVLGSCEVRGVEARGGLWLAHLAPAGYIELAGSTKCAPVLSFSEYDFVEPEAGSPLAAKLLADGEWCETMEADASAADNPQWDELAAATSSVRRRLLGAPSAETSAPYVAPFLGASWNQGSPYNDLSPLDVPCGCSATAAGQEHRYWRWPWRYERERTISHTLKANVGSGQNIERHVIRVNGAEPFDYAKMQPSYNGLPTGRAPDKRATFETARLILWMQSFVKTVFESGGSGGTQKLCVESEDYWFEKGSVMNEYRDGYDNLWTAITNDLANGSPIQVNSPGHQMVVDGYAVDDAGTENEVAWININYGWGSPGGWNNFETAIRNDTPGGRLADFQIGYRPQKIVQFEPVPKVSGSDVVLTWHIAPCYTNLTTGFTLDISGGTRSSASVDIPTHDETTSYTATGLETGYEYTFTVTPVMADGSEARSNSATTTIGTPQPAPSIDSVSSIAGGLELVQEGFYIECGRGIVNDIAVTCSESTVSLEAYPSHLSVLPDESVSVTQTGSVFTIHLDASEVSSAWDGDMLIMTLVAKNSDGTEAYKDLMLRFSEVRQVFDGTFDVVESGEAESSVWFCGTATTIDAKGRNVTFAANAFQGTGTVTLVDSVGGGSFAFAGLDSFYGTLKFGPDVAVSLPAESPYFVGTIVVSGERTLSGCEIPAEASLVLEGGAEITLSNATLLCPVTGSGKIVVSEGSSSVMGEVASGVAIELTDGTLGISVGTEGRVTMKGGELRVTLSESALAWGCSSAVGSYESGDIMLFDSTGELLSDGTYIDPFEPGAFTYDGSVNTWTAADGESQGRWGDAARWSWGRIPRTGEFAKIESVGDVSVVLDAPEEAELVEVRVMGSGTVTLADGADGEACAVTAGKFRNETPVRIATAQFRPAVLEPAAALALADGVALDATVGSGFYGNFTASELKDAGRWRGTVEFTGVVPDDCLSSTYGNAASFVRLTGASGYFATAVTNATPIVLADSADGTAAFTYNNGYGGRNVFIGRLLGNGTFKTEDTTKGYEERIVLMDTTEFEGTLTLTRKTFFLGDVNPNDIISTNKYTDGRIYVCSTNTITVPSGKTWNTGGVHILDAQRLDVVGALDTPSVSFEGAGSTLNVTGALDAHLVTLETGDATINLHGAGVIAVTNAIDAGVTQNFAAGTLRLLADMTLVGTANFCSAPEVDWTTIDTQGHTITLGEEFLSGAGDVLFSSPVDNGGKVIITALPAAFTGTIILDGSTSVTFPGDGDLSGANCRIVLENTSLEIAPEKLCRTIVSAGGRLTIPLDDVESVMGLSVTDKVTLLEGGEVEFTDPYGDVLATLTEPGQPVEFVQSYNVWTADGDEGSFASGERWTRGAAPADGEDALIYITHDTTLTLDAAEALRLGTITVEGSGTLTIVAAENASAIAAAELVNTVPVVLGTALLHPAELKPSAALSFGDGFGDEGLANCVVRYEYYSGAAPLLTDSRWRGDFIAEDVTAASHPLHQWGNGNSRIIMSGVTGPAQGGNVEAQVVLVDGEFGFGWHISSVPATQTNVKRLSGSGTLKASAGGSHKVVTEFWDATAFSGSIEQGEVGGGRIYFAQKTGGMEDGNDKIVLESGYSVRLGDGKSWTAGTGGIKLYGSVVFEGEATFTGATTLRDGAALKFDALNPSSTNLVCDGALTFESGTVEIAFGDGMEPEAGQALISWREGTPEGNFVFAGFHENLTLAVKDNALVVCEIEESPHVDGWSVCNEAASTTQSGANFKDSAETFTITIPATNGVPAGALVRLDSIALATHKGYAVNIQSIKVTTIQGEEVASGIVNGTGSGSTNTFSNADAMKQTFTFDDDCLLQVGRTYPLTIVYKEASSVLQRYMMVNTTDLTFSPIVQSITTTGYRIVQEVAYRKVHTARVAGDAAFADLAFKPALPLEKAEEAFYRIIAEDDAVVALDGESTLNLGAVTIGTAGGAALTLSGGDVSIAESATVAAGGTMALDNATLAVAGSLRLKNGAALRASGGSTLTGDVYCGEGESAVIFVDEGVTLTLAGRIYGDGLIVKRGPGRLVLLYSGTKDMMYPVCEEGVVELGGEAEYSLGGARDLSPFAGYVLGAGSSVYVSQTMLEHASGLTRVENVPEGFAELSIVKADGTVDAMEVGDGLATYGDGRLRVDGDACTFEWEFDGSFASSGLNKTALTADGGYSVNASISEGNLRLYTHPYYNSNSHGYWAWADEWTVAAKFSAPVTEGTNVIALAVGHLAGVAIGLASCAKDEENEKDRMMLFAVTNGSEPFETLLEFEVEGFAEEQHFYLLSKTSDGRFEVYCDGVLAGEADAGRFSGLLGTMQAGSLHGGFSPALVGLTAPSAGDAALMDFVKIYNYGISDAMRRRLFAEYVFGTRTVEWVNYDGTRLWLDESVAVGEMPVYGGEEPVRPSTDEFDFEFAGWTPEVAAVTYDATYTAVFTPRTRSYVVTWNIDGVAETQEYQYGATPEHAIPEKAEDTLCTYEFTGWEPGIAVVTGSAEYTAVFEAHAKWTGDGTEEEPYSLATPRRIAEIVALVEVGLDGIYVAAEGDEALDAISEWLPDGYGVYPTGIAGVLRVVRVATVTWRDEDGSLLGEAVVPFGELPSREDPSKAADAQFTYAFAGWTPEVVPVAGDAEYTATYSSTVNEYVITWRDDDGSVIATTTVAYGETPEHAAPEKAPTAQFTYAFTGWTPEVVAVTGDTEYTATYSSTVNNYTITWKDDDGSVIDTATVAYGETPQHADPAKAATAQFTYAFTGWSPDVASVTGDAEYTATYSSAVNEYTVTWKHENGDVLGTATVAYGAQPEYGGETPAKARTPQYTYAFAGWTPDVAAVTGDAVYTATFTESLRYYTITWWDEEAPQEEGQVGGQGEEPGGAAAGTKRLLATQSVAFGAMPEYPGELPEKAPTAQYSYEFAGWTPEVVAVAGDAEYTATYSSIVNKYTITWKWTNDVIIATEQLEYGATPSREPPESIYRFTGWDPEPSEVVCDATYTAMFGEDIDLAKLPDDYEASDGDVFTGETLRSITIPAGAAVTINGVSVRGAAAPEPVGQAAPAPEFSGECKVATTEFSQTGEGEWTLTTFAELANASIGADVTGDMIKVYSAETIEALKDATDPHDSENVEIETKSAVRTTIKVKAPAPQGTGSRFFKVEFGNNVKDEL